MGKGAEKRKSLVNKHGHSGSTLHNKQHFISCSQEICPKPGQRWHSLLLQVSVKAAQPHWGTTLQRSAVIRHHQWHFSGTSVAHHWHISSISVAHQWHISGTSVAHQWHISGTSLAHHWHICGTSMAHQWYHQWHISGTVLLEQQLGMLLTSTVCTELSGKAFLWAALKDTGQPRRESGHSQCRSLLPAA